ncbi:MAG: hypothetical protein R8K46_10845 [Mariprofundaceae bacterium]
MRADHLAAAILCLLMAAPATAGEDEQEADLALIEFLGEWEADDGSWVDPFSLGEEGESDEQEKTDD